MRVPFRRRKPRPVLVWLLYADGHEHTVGPMDPLSAEVFLALRIAPNPYYNGHVVKRARIIY